MRRSRLQRPVDRLYSGVYRGLWCRPPRAHTRELSTPAAVEMAQKQSIGLYALSLFQLTRALVFPTVSSTAAAAHDPLRPDLPEPTPWKDAGLKRLLPRVDSAYNDSYTGTIVSATGSAILPATTTYTSYADYSVCGYVDGVLASCTCSCPHFNTNDIHAHVQF